MKTGKYLVLISITILLISCTKEIKIKGDNAKSLLVLNGIIENDSIIQVSLSKSTPAIGEQNTGSADITSSATLVLTDNTTSETFTSNSINSKGFYEFGTTAKAGHSYSISVTHPDYTSISSSMKSPENLSITSWDSLSVIGPGYDPNDTIWRKTVHLKWLDPIDANNYAVKVFSIDTVTGLEMNLMAYTYFDGMESSYTEGNEIQLFNDKTFNNSLMTISILFDEDFYHDPITNLPTGEKSYKIILYNLSTEVYNYISSTNKSMNSGNGNPFSEPVAIYSNVKNGIGIFGGVGTAVVKIK